MPKTYEYNEGKQAQENFEQGMKALFQVPKDAISAKKKARKKRAKKTTKRDVSRDREQQSVQRRNNPHATTPTPMAVVMNESCQ